MKKRYGALLFVAAIGVALIAATLLVTNRQNTVDQATKIVAADQAGTDVETDMLKLQAYAASHMKVNVKFTLTGSYDRAVSAAKQAAAASNSVYAAAQASCDKQGVDSIRQARCVSAYVAANGGTVPDVQLPSKATFTHQYVGPAWSFDLPGILFIISGLMAIVAVVSIVHRAVTK